MKAVKLKPGTHMDNGLMCRVFQNQGQELIFLGETSLDKFYKLSLMKKLHYTFLKNYNVYTVENWYTHGQWVDVCTGIKANGP